MPSNAWMVCCCAVLAGQIVLTCATTSSETNATDQPIAGYGFELMMAKLDYLQYKLLELEFGLKERDEETTERLVNLEAVFSWAGHNLTALHEQSRKILAQQTACASHEQMRKDILQLAPKQGLPKNAQQQLLQSQAARRKKSVPSCRVAPANASGVYSIQPGDNGESFEAYCEQTSFGGGWLVIQHRFDGSLNFNRNWTQYRNGFGNVQQEFWMGLERLHQLTSRQPYELMMEIKDFDGQYRYAHYDEFEIGDETAQYVLKKLGSYNGTAGNAMRDHVDMKFSTPDRKNDKRNGAGCAELLESGWWYNDCYLANLNGKYWNKENSQSIVWYDYRKTYDGLAYSRMMIRELHTAM